MGGGWEGLNEIVYWHMYLALNRLSYALIRWMLEMLITLKKDMKKLNNKLARC